MKKLMMYGFVLLIFLFPASSLQALQVFYQPQSQDENVNEAQWRNMWRSTYQQGYRTVIVQWTRHGDADFGGQDGWLQTALQLAEASGLSLILGLNYNTNYYRVLEQGGSTVYFWHHLLSQARRQQAELQADWQLTPKGWYLPYELDDTLVRSHNFLQNIATQLESFSSINELPVHISAFSTGQLSPRVYANWLSTISTAGITVWWQDGRGTRQLSNAVLEAYEQALPCEIGVVHEVFTQTSGIQEEFSAEPVKRFQRPSVVENCHQSAVFSLRYLPFAAPLLLQNP